MTRAATPLDLYLHQLRELSASAGDLAARTSDLYRQRRELIRRARAAGGTLETIGEAAGVTRAQVHRLSKGEHNA